MKNKLREFHIRFIMRHSVDESLFQSYILLYHSRPDLSIPKNGKYAKKFPYPRAAIVVGAPRQRPVCA